MSEKMVSFISEVKNTDFYKKFVEKICVIPGDNENLYFFPKKEYSSKDFLDVNYIEDRFEILFVNASYLSDEDKLGLEQV